MISVPFISVRKISFGIPGGINVQNLNGINLLFNFRKKKK